jgi:inositol phosphorylceramide mannosyltransferase catalytic subunit
MESLSFEDLDQCLLNANGKIIHQIWFHFIPNKRASMKRFEKLKKYRDSWIVNNPNWTYFCWNEKNCENIIKNFYPQHLQMYKKYPYLIQKCDAIRYFILDRYGGIYADMDYECLQSFDLVTDKYKGDIYLVETPNKLNNDIHISNSLIYSKKPNHTFWKKVFIELEKNHSAPIYYGRHLTVMFTTGPAILNRIFNNYRLSFHLDYFPYQYFHPTGLDDKIINDKKKLYAIHKGLGSWESQDSKILIFLYQEMKIILYISSLLFIPLLIQKILKNNL